MLFCIDGVHSSIEDHEHMFGDILCEDEEEDKVDPSLNLNERELTIKGRNNHLRRRRRRKDMIKFDHEELTKKFIMWSFFFVGTSNCSPIEIFQFLQGRKIHRTSDPHDRWM